MAAHRTVVQSQGVLVSARARARCHHLRDVALRRIQDETIVVEAQAHAIVAGVTGHCNPGRDCTEMVLMTTSPSSTSSPPLMALRLALPDPSASPRNPQWGQTSLWHRRHLAGPQGSQQRLQRPHELDRKAAPPVPRPPLPVSVASSLPSPRQVGWRGRRQNGEHAWLASHRRLPSNAQSPRLKLINSDTWWATDDDTASKPPIAATVEPPDVERRSRALAAWLMRGACSPQPVVVPAVSESPIPPSSPPARSPSATPAIVSPARSPSPRSSRTASPIFATVDELLPATVDTVSPIPPIIAATRISPVPACLPDSTPTWRSRRPLDTPSPVPSPHDSMVPKDVTPWSRDETDDLLLHRAATEERTRPAPRSVKSKTARR